MHQNSKHHFECTCKTAYFLTSSNNASNSIHAQAFDEVTIMFSEVVDFNKITAQITPFQIVELLNVMYVEFDALTERHRVYKASGSYFIPIR